MSSRGCSARGPGGLSRAQHCGEAVAEPQAGALAVQIFLWLATSLSLHSVIQLISTEINLSRVLVASLRIVHPVRSCPLLKVLGHGGERRQIRSRNQLAARTQSSIVCHASVYSGIPSPMMNHLHFQAFCKQLWVHAHFVHGMPFHV